MDADEVISRSITNHSGSQLRTHPKNIAFDVSTRNYLPAINTEKWHANDGHYPEQEAGAGWTPITRSGFSQCEINTL
jgi:hypothetical protein